MHVEERWGQSVIKNLSIDLQHKNPNAKGLSVRNIYYCKKFYLLYRQYFAILPQSVALLEDGKVPQTVAQLNEILFSIPWGHHRYVMDKFSEEPAKAFYYVSP